MKRGLAILQLIVFVCKVDCGNCMMKLCHVLKLISFKMRQIDYFKVVCSVTWPLNGSEAAGDLVLIKTSLRLLCKSSCSYPNLLMTKQRGLYQSKVTSSLACIHRPGNQAEL